MKFGNCPTDHPDQPHHPPACLRRVAAVPAAVSTLLGLLLLAPSAHALRFELDNPDLTLRWDNTVKYSAAVRLKNPDASVAGSDSNNNLDDGDLNFKRGLISNRLDLLTEVDFAWRKANGLRISGAAWYDDVYNRSNDNTSPGTNNNVSVPNNQFTNATKRLHGRDAEVLDAFAYGRFDLGDDSALTWRLGRYTLLYGESLFLGGNGIAAAQSSIDIVKALSVPNVQFKEIGRPIGQISGLLQLSPSVTVGAYYQLEWRKFRLPGAGSYFSNADVLDDGGEALYAPGMSANGGPYFQRGQDIKARNNGQGGAQLRFRPSANWEFGVYAAQYHDKTPKIYVRPGSNAGGPNAFGVSIGDYVLAYPEDIRTLGGSFATVLGETNVSGEVSVRSNQPLAGANGDVYLDFTGTADNRDKGLYPVGKTFHVNVSAITLLPGSALWQGAAFVGEVGFNRRLSVTNSVALDPNVSKDAWAARVSFEPSYFQVMPNVDLTVPVGLGVNVGRSSLGPGPFGPHNGGDMSVAFNAEYRKQIKFGLQLTHYFGAGGPLTADPTARYYSYQQNMKDRDFISLSVQSTF
jgi:hypothetical protein